GPADAGARHRGGRVRTRPAHRPARRGRRRPPRLLRAGRGPGAGRPDPRHVRGADRPRAAGRRGDQGGARARHDREPGRGAGAGMRAAIARAARAARFPAIAVVLAFVVGGLVVLLTGNNPFSVYKQLILGAGLDYPFHWLPGNPLGVDPDIAKFNLVATIVATTPLILAGLCVAFAFR